MRGHGCREARMSGGVGVRTNHTMLYYVILYYTILCYTTLYYTRMYYIILYYIITSYNCAQARRRADAEGSRLRGIGAERGTQGRR